MRPVEPVRFREIGWSKYLLLCYLAVHVFSFLGILTAEIILVAFASMLLITLIVFCCLFGFKRCEARQQKSELCSLPSYRTATRPPHLATITAGASGNVESSDGRMNHAFDEILPHYEELFPPLRTEAGGPRAVISIENEATMYTY